MQTQGPALLAREDERFVIGCRADSALGHASPQVNAYLDVTFEVARTGGAPLPRPFVIQRSIPRSRCETGYRSRPLTMRELFDLDPGHGDQAYPVKIHRIEVAFFVEDRWL